MQRILSPSMMCADYANLAKEVSRLSDAGADMLHIDIMDGRFVPNFAMGVQDIQCIRKHTDIPLDVHLMIEDPGAYIRLFAGLGADILYVHMEACRQPIRVLEQIRAENKKAGLAINPETSVETCKEVLRYADYLLVMTVNPGFAGQTYLCGVDEKLAALSNLKERYGYTLIVDGAISEERVACLSEAGVDGFVLGTSALFGKGNDYAAALSQIRKSRCPHDATEFIHPRG